MNIKEYLDILKDLWAPTNASKIRMSISNALEMMGNNLKENIDRQDNVENQFQDVLDETTGKDVINGPAIIAARNGEANLKARLDKEKNEVAAQLAQTSKINSNSNTIKRNTPLITFVDDDGNSAVLDKLLPLGEKYGVPFVVALASNSMLSQYGLSVDELRMMQDEHGFEIASHSKSHLRLDETSGSSNATNEKELTDEIYGSWKIMREHGLNIESLVYPSGANSKLARSIVQRYYKVGVATNLGINGRNGAPLETYSLRRIAFPSGEKTFEYYKGLVDQAIAENGWLIWMLHCGQTVHDETQQQILDDLIAYIQTTEAKIVTLTEGIEMSGNPINVNDQQFYMSKTGENNIVNYVPVQPDSITGNDGLTLDMKQSEFKRFKKHVASIGQNLPLTPSGRRGIVEVSTDSVPHNDYRRFVDNAGQEFISWGQPDDTWGAWKKTLQSDELKEVTISGTVPANGVLVKNVSLGAYLMDRVTTATPRDLNNNLMFSYHDNGNGGSLVLKFFNTSSNPIELNNLVVHYYSTRFS